MRTICYTGLMTAAMLLWAQTAAAQGFNTAAAAQAQNQAEQLFTQSGESANFAIQRDANASVAEGSQNFLSRANAPGTSATSFGTVAGFGGLSGVSTGGLLGASTFGTAVGRGIGGQFGGAGGQFGLGNQFGANTRTTTTAGGTPLLRHRIRPDASLLPTTATITRISRDFERRLTKLPGLTAENSVAVKMDGETAVLTGAVASAAEREMIGRLALLEPGVASVQNELTVQQTAEAPSELAPPAGGP